MTAEQFYYQQEILLSSNICDIELKYVFELMQKYANKPKWIPVSERMPTENDANMYSKVLSQKENGDIITMFFYQVTYQDFISWQPLPEPYKP